MQRELDIGAGRRGRDEGIALVADNNEPWVDRAYALLETWCVERVHQGHAHLPFLFEEFRLLYARGKIEEPRHRNAWAALAMRARRAGLLIGTGQIKRCAHPKGHAHKQELLLIRR